MKTLRFVLGAIAFVFAFATAFAFKAGPASVEQAYIDPIAGCTAVNTTACGGGSTPCEKDLGTPGPGIQRIFDKQTGICVELKMQ